MERLTGFGRHLGPLSGNEPKMDDAKARQLLAIFAYGTNLGPHQMARHLRGTLDADQIAHINRRHITAEKLDAAFRLWSRVGSGTELEVILAAQRAYITKQKAWTLPGFQRRG